MIRSSSHILKFANKDKLKLIHKLQVDYKCALQECVSLIQSKKLPFEKFLNSKDIPNLNGITHSQWKQIIYKNAIEIIKGNLRKTKNKTYKKYQKLYSKCKRNDRHQMFLNKRYSELKIDYIKRITKIKIKESAINIDARLFNIKNSINGEFNKFIKIRLPYFYENKKRAISINIPIKEHKHSLKFKNWKMQNTIKLYKNNLIFSYEKENKLKKTIKNSIGIDIGYKKLLSTSTNHCYGEELINVYNKLSRQERGSKNFKQTLKERDKLINQFCNELNKQEIFNELIIEDLKNVKHKSKIGHKFMNKLQRWSYPKVISKLERLSEEEGFYLKKINPAYTSQQCSKCGTIDKSNRKDEVYQCKVCGLEIDADYNAAINILHRGDYNPSTTKNSFY